MRILLIRHGQTPDNVRGELGTTAPGPGLTDLGKRQASAVPAALVHESIGAIYVSTLQRTHLTARPLASALGLAPVELTGLREISAGDVELRSDPEAVRIYMGTIASWRSTPATRVPGGESGSEFLGRFGSAIATVASDHDGTVAVFSHGAAIRSWTANVSRDLNPDFDGLPHLDNTGAVIVEGSNDDGWVIRSWTTGPLGGSAFEDDTAPDPTGEAGQVD